MPKTDFSGKEWTEGEHIKIDSKEELDRLLKLGYEVDGTKYSLENAQMTVTLILNQGKKKFIADATSISGHILQCLYLYDFQKKKLVLTWVPDTSPNFDLEQTQINMIIEKHTKPLITKKLESSHSGKICHSLLEWVNSEKNVRYGIRNVREIFYLVCVINEKNGTITRRSYHKETITLDDINKLQADSINFDQSLALSFFYLTTKGLDSDDVLIGMIVYDLKKKEPLCFNIQSATRFTTDRVRDASAGIFNVVIDLFELSIDQKMMCKSFVPLPLDSPWYTPLPWICFSVLSPISLEPSSAIVDKRKITIPQFFTFGYSSFPEDANSFVFQPFSSNQNGHAICILNFNDDKEIKYNLRFDQSKGEPLVHLDYAFHDQNELKLITHHPLNLESVYAFNQDLFVAIMSAGLFDSYFTTIIEKGIKGITELISKNPVFKYPLRWIWILDTAIVWLNQNPNGYVILEKLSRYEKLNNNEIEFVKKMFDNHLNLVGEDKDCNYTGLSYLGNMVYQRYKRGMTKIIM